jgi:hypothetical protein
MSSRHRPPRYSLSRPEDFEYYERVRELLSAPPCHGVPHEPDMLLPHVFLGNQNNAESLRTLRKYGVTHVLNCAGYKGPRPEPHTSPYVGLDIDYLEFLAEDVESYDMTQHFREAFNYLDKVKRSGGVALVHCAMGINRSAAVCAAYLMMATHQTLFDVLKTLKRKRRIVLTNHGFQRQLVRYAGAKGLLDDLEPKKDEFEVQKERLEEGIRHHQHLDYSPSRGKLYGAEDEGCRLRSSRPLSDSFDAYCDNGPRFTYYSAGRRTELHIPAASVASSSYNDLSPGNSIFERYMMNQRTYFKAD